MDIESIKDVISNLPHKIPNKADFANYLKLHDIRPTDDIVFYDDFSIIGSFRAHFLFQHFGIPSSVANFTLTDWLKSNQEIEKGDVQFHQQVT